MIKNITNYIYVISLDYLLYNLIYSFYTFFKTNIKNYLLFKS